MRLERRVKRWTDARLIEPEQAEAILAHERDRSRPLLSHAIALLGALAIAIGLVSIVAANWDVIPGRLKIGLDLALVVALGYGAARWDRQGLIWAREIALLVLYGLVMASVALIGQVYQLGGKAHEAMGVWTVLTALAMAQGSSGLLAVVWLMGLESTYAAWLIWLADDVQNFDGLALGAVYFAPLACLVVSGSEWVRQRRPLFAAVLVRLGWTELVLAASLGTFAFYEDTARHDWDSWFWLAFALSAGATAWLWVKSTVDPGGKASRWLLVACCLSSYLPIAFSPGDLGVVSALAFIGLWLLVAVTAHRARLTALLNLATAVIGVRLLVVYFEVFGSLLSTGLGLISGGLLMLGLVWLWARKRRRFAEQLAEAKGQAS